jgi:Uma2 family endonuclease
MTAPVTDPSKPIIIYPEDDGEPMSDNTRQFQWIVTIKENVDALFRNDPNVFVAGDLLWYPVEGDNTIRQAPDTMVAFGRPKGHRGSYRQWEEGDVVPQVVFEVLSPGNRAGKLLRKFHFYEEHGVEEYYIYDPEHNELVGHRRDKGRLIEIPEMNGWISPRLGIRFDMSGPELAIYRPDGQRFTTFLELEEQRSQAQRQAEQAQQRADRLAAQLRAMGIEPGA